MTRATAFLTLGIYQFGHGVGRLTERTAHGLKAHAWIGIGQPTGSVGDLFKGHGQALVLLKMAGKSIQRTKNAILVNDLNWFTHCQPSVRDDSYETPIRRAAGVSSNHSPTYKGIAVDEFCAQNPRLLGCLT